MKVRRSVPRSFQFVSLFLLSAVAGVSFVSSGCDNLPIDKYYSFNNVKTFDLALQPGAATGADTALSASQSMVASADYGSHGTSADLLGTAEATRIYLHSSNPAYTLDNLVYATVTLGADTVAMDSIPQYTGDTYLLHTTNRDIAKVLQDTSVTLTLHTKLRRAPQSPTTLTAGVTIVYTAEPL